MKTFDSERHIPPAELAQLRGPYLARPSDPEPHQWLRWAQEVIDAAPLAQKILDAQAAKCTPKKNRPKS